jgi:hypothetical protein
MTITFDPAAGGVSELVSRTESLLSQRRTMAQWWVELVALLDALGARVATLRQDQSGESTLAEQIRMDAPHLYGSLRRLDEESEALQADLLHVRIQAGESMGDESRVGELSADIRGVLRRLTRLEHRSNSVVLDAYDRDIGGE